MCESLGLHLKLDEGFHTKLADEPFAVLMKELGVEQPEELPTLPPELNIDWFKWLLKELGKEKKGISTLTKWTCPECGLNARIGIKGNPEMVHDPCSEKVGHKVFFVKADGLKHTIYTAKEDSQPEEPNGEERDDNLEKYNQGTIQKI